MVDFPMGTELAMNCGWAPEEFNNRFIGQRESKSVVGKEEQEANSSFIIVAAFGK